MTIVAVVLAGGLARRMGGGDKTLLDLGGRTLLDHVLARVRPQVDAVALNANGDPARFARFGLPVLADPVPGLPGPLAGVLAGMRWARGLGAAALLSVPGDTPLLPPDLVRRLAKAGPLACAESGGRAHPVVALWPVGLEAALAAALAAGERRIGPWAAAQGAVRVVWDEAPDPFLNVNTREDLAAARDILDR